jgi:hypothetical protein
MPIHFRCPHCFIRLAITRRKAGIIVTCPWCQQPVRVPSLKQPQVDQPPQQTKILRDSDQSPSHNQVHNPVSRSHKQPWSDSVSHERPLSDSGPQRTNDIMREQPAAAPVGPKAFVSAPAVPEVAAASTPRSVSARTSHRQAAPVVGSYPSPQQPVCSPPESPPQQSPRKFSLQQPASESRHRPRPSATATAEPPLFEKDIDELLNALPDAPSHRRRPATPARAEDALALLDQRSPASEQIQRLTALIVISFTFLVLLILASLFISIH